MPGKQVECIFEAVEIGFGRRSAKFLLAEREDFSEVGIRQAAQPNPSHALTGAPS